MKTERKTLFHEQIRRIRGEKTQQEVSALLGVDKNKWWRWESGLCEPDLATLVRIAQIFNVSLDWLLGLSVSEPLQASNNESKTDCVCGGMKAQVKQFKEKAEIAMQQATEFLRTVMEIEKGL